ncbi:MAG: S8 family serine peptidase [Actinomycetota bacterium]|nr:S8 family serine peptidase [Actinomycetota bacterium]
MTLILLGSIATLPSVAGAAERNATPAGAAAARAPASVRVPGQVIVRYSERANASRRSALRDSVDADVVRGLPLPGGQLLRLTGGLSADAAMARLRRSRDVLYAEPNVVRTSSATMNDPFFEQLWALRNTTQIIQGTSGTAGADIAVPSAWDLTTGSPTASVAVIDSGVASAHPDLRGQIATNRAERAGNGIDDDTNGYVDDVAGWDFVAGDPDPDDANGHGTHVAGTIAARGNDGVGIVGVAPTTQIMPLRALDANGSGTLANILSAYGYAARNGARVANVSLGGDSPSRAERDAIAAAPGVLFVAAAGNGGSDGLGDNNDAAGEYPCAYDLANVVCVAASDRDDRPASFSNYGAASVDLAAPGTNILSDQPPSSTAAAQYAFFSGTSMAAPHVSGVAALGFALQPGATVVAVKQALLDGTDTRPALFDKTVSGGRLDARRTLELLASASTAPAPVTPPPSTPAPIPTTTPPAPLPATPAPTTTPTQPPPAPAPRDTTAPLAALLSDTRQRISTVRRRGLRARATCLEACAATAVLNLSPRNAKRVRLGTGARSVRIGRGNDRLLTAASTRLSIRLSGTASRRLTRLNRPIQTTLAVTFVDAAGNRRTLRKTITLIAPTAGRR